MPAKAILSAILLIIIAHAANAAAPEFFAFDNGVGRGEWTPEKQAATLKELGYDGISYDYTTPEDLAKWQKAFKQEGLKIYGLYIYTYLDRTNHFDPAFKDAVKLLKGTDTMIWMVLVKPKKKGDYDAEAARNVQEMADLAAEQGVRVALYGHKGQYIETGQDSLRIVKLANRPNAGAMIHLCHEFLSGHGNQLDETIKAVAPSAIMASVCGVKGSGTNFNDIARLDQGNFDVGAYVKKLQAAGYHGPIGLQCYGVPGDIKENLKADMAAWEKIKETLK
jgi:sugar phosphate isomerase/epimerase